MCGVTFVHNESVAALVDRHPDRFIPFAGADIMRGSAAVAALERWVERGFRGLSLRSFMIDRPATDRAYFPFYAKCLELLRQMFRARHPSEHSHVGQLDPDPTQRSWTSPLHRRSRLPLPGSDDSGESRWLPVGVGGMPGGMETRARVSRAGAHRPKYFTAAWRRMGTADAVRADDDRRQGRLRHRRVPDELPLLAAMRRNAYAANKPDVLEAWLWRNAARLLKLE